jgi:chemotaxis methyl-accepting protein methylase
MNQIINPLMDANKLRNFTSQYKRHSIRRLIRPLNLDPHKQSAFSQQNKLRQSAADYFFVYCRQVLPRIEEKIELQLLEKFKDSLHNPAEKKEVHTAYM